MAAINRTDPPSTHVANIGKDVFVDNAQDIKMRVIAVLFEPNRVQYKTGWFHNGIAYSDWFDVWRLTLIE